MADKKLEEKVRIDPDIPWNEPHNLEAARKLGIQYDRKAKVYKDSDGCLVRDKYGQELG